MTRVIQGPVIANVATEGSRATPDSVNGETAQLSLPPELEAAIEAGSISFDDVANVHFKSKDALRDDSARGESYLAAYEPVLVAFRKQHGTIDRMTFGTRARWAVCLTVRPWQIRAPFRRPQLQLHYYVQAMSFATMASLLAGWLDLRVKALRVPDSHHRYFLLQRLYDAFWNAIQLQEALLDTPPTVRQNALDSVWEQLKNADEAFSTATDRAARLAYLEGMGISVLLVLVGALAAVSTVPLMRTDGPAQSALICVLSGCLGAAVSVIFRLSQGILDIKRGESLVLLRWFGGMRPLLGAAFALVLYELVLSGMVPLKLPPDMAPQLALIGFLGFAAGFSEMLVPNLIAKSIKNLEAGNNEASTKTPVMIMATGPLPAAVNGSDYSARLMITGGTPPYTWVLTSGPLPADLSLSADGMLAGRPRVAGSSTHQVRATDAGNPPQSLRSDISITVVDVLVIGPVPPGPAAAGSAYAHTLTASGGISPYSWSLASGSLPDGLELGANGDLRGAPKSAGSYACKIRVQDSTQPSQTSFCDLTMKVV